jgi:hypothetical protein
MDDGDDDDENDDDDDVDYSRQAQNDNGYRGRGRVSRCAWVPGSACRRCCRSAGSQPRPRVPA